MAKKIKCAICGEKFDPDGDVFYTRDDKQTCLGCYESEWEAPSTVVRFGPQGKEVLKFTDHFGADEDGENLEELPVPIKSQKWVSMNAWRGYTDWELLDGYVEAAEGWVTGYPDETVQRKVELSDYYEQLCDGKIVPPCEIWWIFGVTSNIFSTASTIVVRKEDTEKLDEWLKKVNGGVEHFQEMLA